jgi:multiple sugar transport system permease protein
MGLGSRHGDRRMAYIFILPLVAVILLFIVVPVIGTFWTSLFRDVTYLERTFAFLENYRRLLADANFWHSMRFTLLFVAVCIPLELFLGMVFALILNEKLPARGVLRAAVLVP